MHAGGWPQMLAGHGHIDPMVTSQSDIYANGGEYYANRSMGNYRGAGK